MRELTLAKAVIVNGKGSLGPSFRDHYVKGLDMYLFCDAITFNTLTGSFSGRGIMHNKLIDRYSIPDSALSPDKVNYISVDIKPTDRRHTYMYSNRRCYQLTEDQTDYLKTIFDADFVVK